MIKQYDTTRILKMTCYADAQVTRTPLKLWLKKCTADDPEQRWFFTQYEVHCHDCQAVWAKMPPKNKNKFRRLPLWCLWMVNFRRRAWSRRRRELSKRASRLGRMARCATQSCDIFSFLRFSKNISAGGFAVWKYTYKIWIIEDGQHAPDRAVITFLVLPFGESAPCFGW